MISLYSTQLLIVSETRLTTLIRLYDIKINTSVADAFLCGKYFKRLFLFVIVKEHEVEKMFTLKSGRVPPADVKNVIFFVRPRLELMDIIVENVFRSVLTVPSTIVFGLACITVHSFKIFNV